MWTEVIVWASASSSLSDSQGLEAGNRLILPWGNQVPNGGVMIHFRKDEEHHFPTSDGTAVKQYFSRDRGSGFHP